MKRKSKLQLVTAVTNKNKIKTHRNEDEIEMLLVHSNDGWISMYGIIRNIITRKCLRAQV